MNIKGFYSMKDTINKIYSWLTIWEDIFVMLKIDEGLIFNSTVQQSFL